MSLIEKRAWLTLWAMCPGYLVYFAIQIGWPGLTPTVLSKFGLLAAVAGLHAIGYIAGELVFRFRNREEGLQQDERDDAIDALDQGPWDLLLTDIVMPGADGIEVARVAAARQPGIRIMFITGFAAVALSAAQASPQAKVLAKPVHLRDLVGEVERMVAA